MQDLQTLLCHPCIDPNNTAIMREIAGHLNISCDTTSGSDSDAAFDYLSTDLEIQTSSLDHTDIELPFSMYDTYS